jgi:hypothetical protein
MEREGLRHISGLQAIACGESDACALEAADEVTCVHVEVDASHFDASLVNTNCEAAGHATLVHLKRRTEAEGVGLRVQAEVLNSEVDSSMLLCPMVRLSALPEPKATARLGLVSEVAPQRDRLQA